MRGQKNEEEEEEELVAKKTQVFRLGGLFKKGREEKVDVEEEEEQRFRTHPFNFRPLHGGVESWATSKGGAPVQQKKVSMALNAVPFGRGGRPDQKTVANLWQMPIVRFEHGSHNNFSAPGSMSAEVLMTSILQLAGVGAAAAIDINEYSLHGTAIERAQAEIKWKFYLFVHPDRVCFLLC